jgi:hypothetical protein
MDYLLMPDGTVCALSADAFAGLREELADLYDPFVSYDDEGD